MLADLILHSRVNQTWNFSGMDSPEECMNKLHFARYPHKVIYNYNSRGFRDREWPDNLQDAIWCIGDSFTVGLGAPIEHTWPYLLEQRTGQRTINVSMDGAANDWISRRTVDIIKEIDPKKIIVHWSYLQRREADDATALEQKWKYTYSQLYEKSWPKMIPFNEFDTLPLEIQTKIKDSCDWDTFHEINDESRRMWRIKIGEGDIENGISNINKVNQPNSKVIHSFVPEFSAKEDTEKFYVELDKLDVKYIAEIPKLDLARDYHHYGLASANYLVDRLLPLL